MQQHCKRTAKTKLSPYRMQTNGVNTWKRRLGLSDAAIGARSGYSPSTITRNISNVNCSQKVQKAIVKVLVKASGEQVSAAELLVAVYQAPSVQSAA